MRSQKGHILKIYPYLWKDPREIDDFVYFQEGELAGPGPQREILNGISFSIFFFFSFLFVCPIFSTQKERFKLKIKKLPR